ncbi:MAG: hypothetical protein U5K43_13220 [Halofilum sp. (in: g-proteobacteria)]|nr:hypothetical protein [Halofilum sp. (in: g-proteobacteria)]
MHIAPFDPERCTPHARVYEDDRHGVLAADPQPRPVAAGLAGLERAALSDPGRAPGTVVVGAGRPLRLHAVVHDVEREPDWHEEWVAAATAAVLDLAARRGLARLALPLLGTVHGRLPRHRALALLAAALARAPARPERLWLIDAGALDAARLRRLVDAQGGAAG